MFKYKGVACPYCHKEFQPTDEILICPDCGAPYHRACVQQSGGCILTDLHEKGEMWEPPHRPDDSTYFDGTAPLRCSRCGSVNPPDRIFCEVCGNDLNRNTENENANPQNGQAPPFHQMAYNPYTTPFGGLSPDEEIEGVPVHDLAIYIRENTHYFLPKMKDFSRDKKKISWNWPVFLLDFYYLIYRKMWGLGALVLFLSLLLGLPSALITLESALMTIDPNISLLARLNLNPSQIVTLSNVCFIITLGLKLLLSTMFNHLYGNKVLREVKKLRQEAGSSPDYSTRLAAKGGTSRLAILICFIATLILSSGVSVLLTSLMMGFGF